ncbi:response regulator transcription factor [Lysinibacillus sphaericus]|uniref:Sensory transduction protein n=1 Tax=Lysinibacillus sphaericus OT4b.31 TaxID=1285586 RepID=R7ZHY7_LYSSH|nr:response regulator transcription factor [Lysinibacillus sphaericus]EON73671.1 sensory transduction protein [Lysinibacillus sphaericus OT4b.31]
MTNRILIIEDEESIARVLQLELQFEGYQAEMAHTGTDGLLKYREQQWDLILLDIMLPEMSGIDVLKRIRATELQTPVILLTAKSDVEDKVKGLDLGANDYITKPFDIEELLARVRTALRFSQRSKGQQASQMYGHLSIDEQTRDVVYYDKNVQLTPREYDLLLYLLKHPKQVLTREQILEAVWGYDYYGDTNVVDVYIRYVRQKLEVADDTPIIHTIRGVGYVLKEHKHET